MDFGGTGTVFLFSAPPGAAAAGAGSSTENIFFSEHSL